VATIKVRNVPEDVVRTYEQRAEAVDLSMEEYLLERLCLHARRHPPDLADAQAEMKIEAEEGWAAAYAEQELPTA